MSSLVVVRVISLVDPLAVKLTPPACLADNYAENAEDHVENSLERRGPKTKLRNCST